MINKHVVVITAFNRPSYLKEVLDSLSRCKNQEKYKKIVHLDCFEDGSYSEEIINLVKNYDVEIVFNRQKGIDQNIFASMRYAFNFSDFIISLEEDHLLSVDALLYFEYCCDRFKDDPDAFCVNARLGMISKSSMDRGYGNFFEVCKMRFFASSIGIWRRTWKELERNIPQIKSILKYNFGIEYHGEQWDYFAQAVRGDRSSIIGYIPRVKDIGKNGAHNSDGFLKEYFDEEVHLDDYKTSDEHTVSNYYYNNREGWVDASSKYRYLTYENQETANLILVKDTNNDLILHLTKDRDHYHLAVHFEGRWVEQALHFKSDALDVIELSLGDIKINSVSILDNYPHLKGSYRSALAKKKDIILSDRFLARLMPMKAEKYTGRNNPSIGAFYYAWYVSDAWKMKTWRFKAYDGEPNLGWYNSFDEKTITNHISMAKEHGIDFFIISYDGSESCKYAISNICNLAEKLDFKITIHYELVNIFSDPVVVNSFFYKHISDSMQFLTPLFESKAWYKLDDKPTMFLYTSRRIEGSLSQIDEIRSIAKGFGAGELFIFGDEIWWENPSVASVDERMRKLNGVYAYNMYLPGNVAGNNFFEGKDYLNFISKPFDDYSNYARKHGVVLAPTIMPRYNDFAVRSREGHYPISDEGGVFFSDYYNWSKQHFCGNHKILLITSFNEWYEDTQIEPYVTKGKGDDYDKEPSYGDKFLILTKTFKEDMENN